MSVDLSIIPQVLGQIGPLLDKLGEATRSDQAIKQIDAQAAAAQAVELKRYQEQLTALQQRANRVFADLDREFTTERERIGNLPTEELKGEALKQIADSQAEREQLKKEGDL